jgi:hypothetical protein
MMNTDYRNYTDAQLLAAYAHLCSAHAEVTDKLSNYFSQTLIDKYDRNIDDFQELHSELILRSIGY